MKARIWNRSSKIFRVMLVFLTGITLTLCSAINVTGDTVNSGLTGNTRQLFAEAQQLFDTAKKLRGESKKQLMLKSAALFIEITEKHDIQNGYLLYNAGNAFYEAGEIGKAILYYRRAEILLPGYSELRHNLNLAREQTGTTLEADFWWNEVLRAVFFWHYIMDFHSKKILFVASFMGFWLFLIFAIWKRHFVISFLIIVFVLLSSVFGVSAGVTLYQTRFVKQGIIISKDVVARKGPGLAYEQAYEQPMPEGVSFKLIQDSGRWWYIKLPDGRKAWIEASDADLI